FTEGGQNAIARVDAKTKEVTLFRLPASFPYANLNTMVFDRTGIAWFTGQSGVHGRVDPRSGKVDAWASPRGRGSYGITVTPAGDVWFCSLAGDYIAKLDLASGQASVIDPPKKGVGPRRIWSDSKGVLWSSFWNSGGIGRYDPATGQWTTYPMPRGSRHLLGLCRRQGSRVGDRLGRQRHPALRSGKRELRDLPERPATGKRAPDAGPAGRGVGRRIRHRPFGGDPGLSLVAASRGAARAIVMRLAPDAGARRREPKMASRREPMFNRSHVGKLSLAVLACVLAAAPAAADGSTIAGTGAVAG